MKEDFKNRPIEFGAASGCKAIGTSENIPAQDQNMAEWAKNLIRMLERSGYHNLALAILLCVNDQNNTASGQIELNEFVELALRLLENTTPT